MGLIASNLYEIAIAVVFFVGAAFAYLKRRDKKTKDKVVAEEKEKDRKRAEEIDNRIVHGLDDVVRKHDDAGYRD